MSNDFPEDMFFLEAWTFFILTPGYRIISIGSPYMPSQHFTLHGPVPKSFWAHFFARRGWCGKIHQRGCFNFVISGCRYVVYVHEWQSSAECDRRKVKREDERNGRETGVVHFSTIMWLSWGRSRIPFGTTYNDGTTTHSKNCTLHFSHHHEEGKPFTQNTEMPADYYLITFGVLSCYLYIRLKK